MQMMKYALDAIYEMVEGDNRSAYSEFVNELLENNHIRDILASIYAIARKESGVEHIGQYVLHRHEGRHNVFSYSHYHILMKDDGLKARRKLNLSEGQTLHPRNGTELLLGFLVEKLGKNRLQRIFPLRSTDLEGFASAYNGKYWKQYNPDYVMLLEKYLEEGYSILDELGK